MKTYCIWLNYPSVFVIIIHENHLNHSLTHAFIQSDLRLSALNFPKRAQCLQKIARILWY